MTKVAFRRAVALAAVLAIGGAGHAAHRALVERSGQIASRDESNRLMLPSPLSLKLLSLGQDVTLADAYWLRFVQYVGNPDALNAGLPQAFDLADLITDIDPRYGYAYQSAGIVLNTARRLDESDAILEKGMQNVPNRWQLPFYSAFNHWYERNDLPAGVALLKIADGTPGAPRYLANMIARLSSAAGQIEAAEEHFEEMLRTTQEPSVRSRVEERLAAVRMEKVLLRLDEAIARYKQSTGQNPGSLDDLRGEYIDTVPVAPDGSEFRYDPSTGEVATPDGQRLNRPVRTAGSHIWDS